MLMTPHSTQRNGPLMPEVVALLREWGATVDVIHPGDRFASLDRLRVDHDLYVLKTRTELGLSIAGALHAVDAPILNPWPVAMMMKDKIAALRRLLAAGVPVPETYVVSSPQRLARLLDEGPVVIKPARGSKERSARVVWDADELDDAIAGEGPILAQRYHKPDGPDGADRKIYCIGGQLFGVLRKLPAYTFREKCGEPFTITSELRDIALRCADAFSVELFGVDLIFSDGAPYVVDIHSFPGFKGVPDAALRLADYVYATAQRVLVGESAGGCSALLETGRKAVSA
jgi:ribosomal protein S6--L-glutamate ligase